jgi:amino acid transporter
MAIGGMIGGGIFSVLGVTIQLAGHLAFACFLLAGAVALATAHAYARLTLRAGTSGGPYAYLRAAGHPQVAGLTSWLLVVGYVLALAVYAFTFGHYVADVVGLGDLGARGASLLALAAFWLLNARGVGASSITEDAVVAAKLLVLAGVAGIGLAAWSSERLIPLADVGYTGVLVGAASIFVAYEGFELLSYDHDDIADPQRTLPRALYLSVAVVVAVYVTVTLGSQMLVPDRVLVAQREVAFAAVGQEALGRSGRWIATGAAVLATASAINATLFSTARLLRDLSLAGEVPASLGRSVGGLPTRAMALLAAAGASFAMVPSITDLLILGSLTFLVVFGLIDLLHARSAERPLERAVGWSGATACVAAVLVVVRELGAGGPTSLLPIACCLAGTAVLRAVFLWHRRAGH